MENKSVKMSDEQFEALIKAIEQLANNGEAAEQYKSKGSFGNCDSRFGGQRDNDAVEEFIHAIETYKDVEQITDKDALRGLSLLFYDIAVTWWRGVRREAHTWEDALKLLRDHFSPTKPAYQLYMEIFETKQSDHEPIDTFICQKRALLAKLPADRHDEDTELDFIYGLLGMKYRKHIPRHEIKSFKDLLEKGRSVERNN